MSHHLPLVRLCLLALLALATATTPPTYVNYNKIWSTGFAGKAGALPNAANWNTLTVTDNENNEVQTYTNKKANIQLSGSSTLQIIPVKSSSGAWTSARIESVYTLTPTAGKITKLEAKIRLGSSTTKQGIWPAFWMLGESFREGTVNWPECGELDIMENINGATTASGAMHCDVYPGGICNEGSGITGVASLADDGAYHVWRILINRVNSVYTKQSITWQLDGVKFLQITGAQIGNATVWAAVAQSPLYFILNVAVGGNWPGAPNSATTSGTGSMMEVAYVAHYVSK